MKIISFCRYVTIATALLLSACATTNSPSSSEQDKGKWNDIGLSASGNIRYELDVNSIKRQGDTIEYRNRKIIIDPNVQYYRNTPVYKTALSTTLMDCRQKTFRVLEVELYNNNHELLREDHFSETDLRPMNITKGSAAEQEYQTVCHHPDK